MIKVSKLFLLAALVSYSASSLAVEPAKAAQPAQKSLALYRTTQAGKILLGLSSLACTLVFPGIMVYMEWDQQTKESKILGSTALAMAIAAELTLFTDGVINLVTSFKKKSAKTE